MNALLYLAIKKALNDIETLKKTAEEIEQRLALLLNRLKEEKDE